MKTSRRFVGGLSLLVLVTTLAAAHAHAEKRRHRRGRGARNPAAAPRDEASSVQEPQTQPEPTPAANPSLSPSLPASQSAPPSAKVDRAAKPDPISPSSESDSASEPGATRGAGSSAVRDEFNALMADLVLTRSRVAVLGRELFRSRIRVKVQNRAGDTQLLKGVSLELDGAPIYKASSQTAGDATRTVFEGAISPGPHLLRIRVDQQARASESYKYTVGDEFRFQIVRDKLTEVTVVLADDSNIASDFADDGEGEYDVRTRVRVATRALGAR